MDGCKIRADYEGWWLFEDWPEKIVKQSEFSTYEDMLAAYCKLIKDCNDYYDNCVMGKYNMYAFYNNCDLNFVKIVMRICKYFIVLLF